MMEKRNTFDEAIGRAIKRLPEAPPDPTFAARVLARAAVTPQCEAVGALAERAAEIRPAFKLVWAMAGFALGVAICISFYISLLSLNMNSGAAPASAATPPTTRPTVSQSVMVFDPLEAALTDHWNGGEGDR